MFIKKSKYIKLLASARRANELQEIICPCEQHEYLAVEEITEYPYMGGPSVEVRNKRKLICRKCKKIIYDYDGCGNHYQYKVLLND